MIAGACAIAGITKKATPHSLRHAFATHSFEDGCDIRRIQKVLGHVRLDTTTIYVTVASERTSFTSPLDRLAAGVSSTANPSSVDSAPSVSSAKQQSETTPTKKSVGTVRVHHRFHPDDADQTSLTHRRHQITIEINGKGFRSFLTGTEALIQRPGYVKIDFPASESWQAVIDSLPRHVVERIETPEFYRLLQDQITRKVSQAVADQGATSKSVKESSTANAP